MSVKDPKLTPEDELRHQWKQRPEMGLWPEVMEHHQTEGCICWRCASGCKMELPNYIMAPFWEVEWQQVLNLFEHDPSPRAKKRWTDRVEEEKKPREYDEGNFVHLYVWTKDAGAHILTVHSEMGPAHRHVVAEPCVKGTEGEAHHIYTGYFMCLTPENDAGVEDNDMDEHAIEAISVTWKQGEETILKAFDKIPNKWPPKCSSIRNKSRGMCLFNRDVTEGKESTEEHRYNRPHEPRPSNPSRTLYNY
jgi:hypothetical protein